MLTKDGHDITAVFMARVHCMICSTLLPINPQCQHSFSHSMMCCWWKSMKFTILAVNLQRHRAWVKKSSLQNFLQYFHCVNYENYLGCCPNFGPFIWIYVNHFYPQILAIQFSLLKIQEFLKIKTKNFKRNLIKYNICYMNFHIICSKCPSLADTCLQSLVVVFHSIVNGFHS